MPIWVAMLLGAVQGLAEFLPISSSGHLVLVQELVDFHQYGADHVTFDVILHLGTLTAVVIAFWSDVKSLVVEFFKMVFDGFKLRNRPYRRMVVMVILATLPLVIGAVLEGVIESAFTSTLVVGLGLIFTACVLWTSSKVSDQREKAGTGGKDAGNATFLDAVKVGFMQLLAVLPGVSRSGSTICAGQFCGFSREFAVRFAFIMSIPAVLGSVVFKLDDIIELGMEPGLLVPSIVGFITSAVSGYLAIILVRVLTKKNSFRCFAVYCAVVGIITVIANLI